MRDRLRRIVIAIAGAGFVFAAMAAIEYQEFVAPNLERLNARFPAVTMTLAKLWP